jgi:outer membrane scaffolding protein for murein synthesis (MipA/OmpV family)
MRRSASAMAALQKLYDDVSMSPIVEVKETALVIGYIINGLVDLGIARMQ